MNEEEIRKEAMIKYCIEKDKDMIIAVDGKEGQGMSAGAYSYNKFKELEQDEWRIKEEIYWKI